MNIPTNNPTAHEVFESIWRGYCYPNSNVPPSGILSQDFQNEAFITYLEVREKFVDSVAKKGALPPFIFDRSLQETTLKKKNRLGKLFYNLSAMNAENRVITSQFDPNLPYEVSENSKILSEVANQLSFNDITFTGNPMSKINTAGLLEGDLINTFVDRLRDAIERKAFQTKVAERKKDSTQCFKETKSFIEHLNANNLDLYGVPMVFCYRMELASAIKLADSDYHLKTFLKALETDSAPNSAIGWCWKREYITELSYCYHLVLFFGSSRIFYNPPSLQDTYRNYWNAATAGQGACFIPRIPDIELYGYPYSFPGLLSEIQRMLMRDIFLRLEPNPKFDHVGMGTLLPSTNKASLDNKLASLYPINTDI